MSFLGVDDIKTISTVNSLGYIITKKYFESMCVLSLPELITSDFLDVIYNSQRQYKYAVYKLTRKINGNLVELLKQLPFNTTIKTAFYWENISELALDQLESSEFELFPSQISKSTSISNNVTKINFSHRPISDLVDILKKFSNIKELHLSNVTDDCVFYEQSIIPKPANLKKLRVSWRSFNLRQSLLKLFSGLTLLEFRYIEDVEFIKTLIEINKLTLKHLILQITTIEVAEISICCQLTHLEVDCGKFNVSLKKILFAQKNLRYLALESPLIDESLICFLESSRTIRTLSLNNSISNVDIVQINLSCALSFRGDLNKLIPISDSVKNIQTKMFNSGIKLIHLSELQLMNNNEKYLEQQSKFNSFEEFRDYHISSPLSSEFLENLSATRLRVDWTISLYEFRKINMGMKHLELFHFKVRIQDFREFYSFLDPTTCFGNLRFIVFNVIVSNINEICIVQNVLNNSIDENSLGNFFKPFVLHVDLDFKKQKRNIIYFPTDR